MKKRSILLISVLSLVIVFLAACGDGGAKGTITRFFQAMSDADSETMVELSVEELKSDVKKIGDSLALAKENGKEFSVEVSEIELNESDNKADATFTVKTTIDGVQKEEKGRALMAKVDGKWLISSINK